MTFNFERAVPIVLGATQPRPDFFEALLQTLRQMSTARVGVIEPQTGRAGRGTWVAAGAAAGAAAASGVVLGLRRHRRATPRVGDRPVDRVRRPAKS